MAVRYQRDWRRICSAVDDAREAFKAKRPARFTAAEG